MILTHRIPPTSKILVLFCFSSREAEAWRVKLLLKLTGLSVMELLLIPRDQDQETDFTPHNTSDSMVKQARNTLVLKIRKSHISPINFFWRFLAIR